MTGRFILVSRWTLGAPPETVWELLREPGEWPGWWPYVRSVTLLRPGGDQDLGARRRFVWGSLLGYGLGLDITTTRVLRHRELEGRAGGDLDGVGTWQLAPWGDGTRVGYRWEVDLRRPWMRLAAPLLSPLFAWNHHGVMRAGARGMARQLGCTLEGYEALDAGRIPGPGAGGAGPVQPPARR
jgi:hypothetical protein